MAKHFAELEHRTVDAGLALGTRTLFVTAFDAHRLFQRQLVANGAFGKAFGTFLAVQLRLDTGNATAALQRFTTGGTEELLGKKRSIHWTTRLI